MMLRTLGLVAGLLATAVCRNVVTTDAVSLMDIQGRGERSPLEGEVVTTRGIVTAIRADERGFWLQDVGGDGDLETSDAVLVWGRAGVAVGDDVRLRGNVVEFVGREGDRPLTELADIESLDVLSSGNDLPPALTLTPLPTESVADAIEYWSRLESMRVRFEDARVVAPTNRFGETVVVMESNGPVGRHVFVRPLADGRVDYNPERILLDDGIRDAIEGRAGDEVRDLVGIVDYGFGNYRVQPAAWEHREGDRVVLGVRQRGGVAVVSFNVENLLELEEEALDEKIDSLSAFIIGPLLLPEILVLQEVESESVLGGLTERVNREQGTSYVAKALGSSDGRGIENAFLYDSKRVSLLESFLLSGPLVEEAFGAASPSPGREPLVGRFEHGGVEFWIVGNHLKSKSGDDPLFGARQPPVRATEVVRKAQARAVRAYVTALLGDEQNALVLVAGDFNDFAFGEPGEGPDHPLAILEGLGESPRLTNLISTLDEPYTFIYQGNAQVLDHMLLSEEALVRVEGFEIVHGNADDPDGASDHDPLVVRLSTR